jgi:uncharacterized protein (UPF0212 family)
MVAQQNGRISDGNPVADLYQVSLTVPWIVRNVPAAQDAINIAVSEVGKCVQRAPKKQVRDCEITVQKLSDAQGQQTSEAVLVVANTALVGLLLNCEVYAGNHSEAEVAARREIGEEFEAVPLVPVDAHPGITDRDETL